MFIAVDYSSNFGMNYQTFKTHKEAYEYLAHSVKISYDNFDLMEFYPFDNVDDCELYNNGNGTRVYAGYDWCNCYCYNDGNDYETHWIIIEVQEEE